MSVAIENRVCDIAPQRIEAVALSLCEVLHDADAVAWWLEHGNESMRWSNVFGGWLTDSGVLIKVSP